MSSILCDPNNININPRVLLDQILVRVFEDYNHLSEQAANTVLDMMLSCIESYYPTTGINGFIADYKSDSPTTGINGA
jgi:hypothetical protein